VSNLPDLFIAIDEHGRVLKNELRVEDQDLLQKFFASIEVSETGALLADFAGERCIVEAFDAPWVAVDLSFENGLFTLTNTYGFQTQADPAFCYFDEWDRLHGATLDQQVPWVLNRAAQEKFFDLLDEYDDESFSVGGLRFTPRSAFVNENDIKDSAWWTNIYKEEVHPGWDIKVPHPAFVDTFPRMKQPRSRVMVLGSGEGHDAAYFSEMGHLVTAVDFSEEAIARAKSHYGTFPINFMQANAFQLPKNYDKNVDIIVEHTFFCAIPPEKRNQLVHTWNRCLVHGGYLMGVFFVTEKRIGPPFGASEWEIRERLKKDYHILFWGRWRQSPERRQGRELFVLAQKK
jgi:protein-L-isoaspartate O-methyltransferase